ncbi:hypothetical protein AB1Y20_023082 [Prymnesium parvum]|uniref:PX domain-containing protein n=1 Tax=Prymnesium parvum TaxID=97485 RepID=A0AB34JF45_PRYPA
MSPSDKGPRSSFSRWWENLASPPSADPGVADPPLPQSPVVERCEILGQALALRSAASADVQVLYTIMVHLAQSTRVTGSDGGRRIVQRDLNDFKDFERAMRRKAGGAVPFRRRRSAEDPPPLPASPSQLELQDWLQQVVARRSLWEGEIAVFLGLTASESAATAAEADLTSDALSAAARALQEAAQTSEVPSDEVVRQALLAAQEMARQQQLEAFHLPPATPAPSAAADPPAVAEEPSEGTSRAGPPLAAPSAAYEEPSAEARVRVLELELQRTRELQKAEEERRLALEAQMREERELFSSRLARLEEAHAAQAGLTQAAAQQLALQTSAATEAMLAVQAAQRELEEQKRLAAEERERAIRLEAERTPPGDAARAVSPGGHALTDASQRTPLSAADLEEVVKALAIQMGAVYDDAGVARGSYADYGVDDYFEGESDYGSMSEGAGEDRYDEPEAEHGGASEAEYGEPETQLGDEPEAEHGDAPEAGRGDTPEADHGEKPGAPCGDEPEADHEGKPEAGHGPNGAVLATHEECGPATLPAVS